MEIIYLENGYYPQHGTLWQDTSATAHIINLMVMELFEKEDSYTTQPLTVFHRNIRNIFVALVSCQDAHATPYATILYSINSNTLIYPLTHNGLIY
jgi:hypothetical protein